MAVAKPKTLGEALAKCTAEIKSMRKLDKNRHGGYDYVPVDDVYDEVRKVLSANGVTVCQELAGPSNVFPATTGKSGKEEFWIKNDYSYCFVYGDERVCAGGNTSMARMSMGSQACGANASYGMKNFLRSTFLIPMGEYDIDSGEHEEQMEARDKERSKSTPARKDEERPSSNEDALGTEATNDFIDRFTKKLNECDSEDDVRDLYKKNRDTIDKLSEGQRKAIIGACEVVVEELKSD